MKGKVKFVNKDKSQFFAVLRKRVDDYFKDNKISKHANTLMVIKTINMVALYFVPYFLILTGGFSYPVMILLCMVMGLGHAGMGMSVQHDANHGAYSSNATVNKILGYSLNLLGGNVFNWKNQHNILHHTYTNVDGFDEDIDGHGIIRLSPEKGLKPIQRFQQYYGWFFYGMLSLTWALMKDYRQFFKHLKNGVNPNNKKENILEFANLVFWKLVFYAYIFVIPMMVLDLAWWQVLIGNVAMLYTSGFVLTVIFQLAHINQASDFRAPDATGNIETDWAIHQINNTANFSESNKLISWYVGGLNYQIEHHLFPKISHIHYRELAKIVKRTATEYDIPYNTYPTFFSAVKSHFKMLRAFGRGDEISRNLELVNVGGNKSGKELKEEIAEMAF